MSVPLEDPPTTDQSINLQALERNRQDLSVPIYWPVFSGHSSSAFALLVRGNNDKLKVAVSGYLDNRPHRDHQLKASDYLPKSYK